MTIGDGIATAAACFSSAAIVAAVCWAIVKQK